MPDNRLGYSRGIMEQLKASHSHLSQEELLDLVCHLTKTYVLDQTIPFDIPLPERAEDLKDDAPYAPPSPDEVQDDDTPEVRFARLIEGLKRRTRLPQLNGFTVDDSGRAVLIVDNQKITFGERVTVEFVPVRQNPTTPTPAPVAEEEALRRAPGATPAPEPEPRARARPGAPPPPPKTPTPPKPKPEDPPADDGYDASVERFRRLDLD